MLNEAKHLASAIKTSAESRSNKGSEQRRSGSTGADAYAIVATARAACSSTASKQVSSVLYSKLVFLPALALRAWRAAMSVLHAV
eukprot:4539343-Pleurochrysis_carterae.AAC.9